ncbi:prepilin-type N-terminal cleavage/methylation domain-containing protein [Lachnospiraceae bacterium 62-35]
MERGDNRGISLIELLAGIAILAMIGIMMTGFLKVSARLGGRTIAYAHIQQESRTVMRRLTRGVMNGKSLYIKEEENGTLIFLGEICTEAETTTYMGEIFYFDREHRSLYQNRNGSFTIEQDKSQNEFQELSCAAIKEDICRKDYLITDSLEELELSTEAGDLFKTESKTTVSFWLTFTFGRGESYSCHTMALMRNDPQL